MSSELFLSAAEVCALVAIPKSTMYARINRNEFPPPIYLTASQSSAAWISEDVLRWRRAFEASKANRGAARRERRRRASSEYYYDHRAELLAKAAVKYATHKEGQK